MEHEETETADAKDMALINPTILYGLVFAAVPILLHLLLKSKPKRVEFPALRLVQARRRQNVRRLQLRHLWLLLLRVGLVVLVCLVLARPSLPPAHYAPTLGEWLRLAGVLAAVLFGYWWTLRRWRRQGVPRHTLLYRRTFLRAATGVCGVALLLLLVVWPYKRRISAEWSGPAPVAKEEVPVAAVFLFDTSLSMSYCLENKTRLDVARDIALQQMNRLPGGSRVSVADTSERGALIFQADLSSARARIEALKVRPFAVSLDERLEAALDLQVEDRHRALAAGGFGGSAEAEQQDTFVREVYVFTDLARHAWNLRAGRRLVQRLKKLKWLSLYLIDVGADSPLNLGLSAVRLSEESVPQGGRLFVRTAVFADKVKGEQRVVELYLQSPSGKLVKQGQQVVSPAPDAPQQVEFVLESLKGPFQQGEVRLESSDPFTPDDVRYFTVRVREPTRVLLVAPSPQQVQLLQSALAPTELVKLGRARYRCRYARPQQLERMDLSPFRVLALVSVPELSSQGWKAVEAFVKSGGGLVVFLGTYGVPTAVSYNSKEAQEVLPAELLAALRFSPPEFLDLRDLSHPTLRKFKKLGGAADLASQEVRRFWEVKPHDKASVVVRYTDSEATPAVVEETHGEGRCLLVTTTVDLRGWSDLPRAGWQYVAWVDQLFSYLAGAVGERFNYIVGEQVHVPLPPTLSARRFLVRTPDLQQFVQTARPGADVLTLDQCTQIGHYEVVPAVEGVDFRACFSVNGPERESRFQRLSLQQLDELFGKDRYSLAKDMKSLTRRVRTGRLGVEIVPTLLPLLLAVFLLELIVANWFYDEASANQLQLADGETSGRSRLRL